MNTPNLEQPASPPPPENTEPAPPSLRQRLEQSPLIAAGLRWFAKYGTRVGLWSYFAFASMSFFYCSFPMDRARDWIVAEVARSQASGAPKTRSALSIGKLQLYWLSGVTLTDVSWSTITMDNSKPPQVFHADKVIATLPMSSWFGNPRDMNLTAKAMSGDLAASIRYQRSAAESGGSSKEADPKKPAGPKYDQTLHVDFSDINLGEVPIFRDIIGNDLYGTAKGTIDLVMLEGRAERTNGHITIDIDNCAVGDGKKPFKFAALKAAFANSDEINLPAISLGSISIDISVEGGQMKFKKIESKGKDIDLELDGTIKLKDRTMESEMQLGLRFKFNDSFKKKGPTIEGLLLMLDAVPQLRNGKHGDQYSLKVLGNFQGNTQIIPGPPPPNNGPAPQ